MTSIKLFSGAIITLGIILSSYLTNAQINPMQVSLELGVGGCNYRPDTTKSGGVGFHTGLFFKHPIGEVMQLKTGVSYELKGIHNNAFSDSLPLSAVNSPESMSVLSIPLLYGLEFRKDNRGISLLVGPSFGLILSDNYYVAGKGSDNTNGYQVSLANFEFGLITQADVFWDNFYRNIGFAVGFRNHLGLTSVVKSQEGFKRKTNVFQINFGLRYNI